MPRDMMKRRESVRQAQRRYYYRNREKELERARMNRLRKKALKKGLAALPGETPTRSDQHTDTQTLPADS